MNFYILVKKIAKPNNYNKGNKIVIVNKIFLNKKNNKQIVKINNFYKQNNNRYNKKALNFFNKIKKIIK